MVKITKRTVDALSPRERERVVWDDDLKGFGVRIHPSGRKVYIVKTRFRARAVKVTIGPRGAVTPAGKPAGTVQWVVSSRTADMDRPAMADQALRSRPSRAFRRSQIRSASSSVSPTNAVGT